MLYCNPLWGTLSWRICGRLFAEGNTGLYFIVLSIAGSAIVSASHSPLQIFRQCQNKNWACGISSPEPKQKTEPAEKQSGLVSTSETAKNLSSRRVAPIPTGGGGAFEARLNFETM